jgi:L-ascorbate metabolism protein UlaG (beta-lactamase superfamily)
MPARIVPVLLLAAACRPASAPPTAPAAAAPQLAATYLANEGVLLEAGGARVIIDGLFRPNDLPYSVLPDAPRAALESAIPPWDGIDLVLVSHLHVDHFHAEAVGLHLARAAGARLVTSREVAGLVAAGYGDQAAIAPRIREVAWAVGRSETVEAGGVRVTLIGLSHGDGPMATVENFGHLVELGGFVVFHAGDAVPSDENFASAGLAARAIDVAFLPWWHIADDQAAAVVRRHIAPRRLVLIHVAPSEEAQVEEAIRSRAPEAVLFRRVLADRIELSATRPPGSAPRAP